jgi:hypothetical protein
MQVMMKAFKSVNFLVFVLSLKHAIPKIPPFCAPFRQNLGKSYRG